MTSSPLQGVLHPSAIVPRGDPRGLQANDELFFSASEQKASEARVARAKVPIEETLEQGTRTLRLQGGDRSSPYAAVRGLVRCDLEGAPGIRLQAVCDPRVPVDCGEEFIIFG